MIPEGKNYSCPPPTPVAESELLTSESRHGGKDPSMLEELLMKVKRQPARHKIGGGRKERHEPGQR